MFIFAFKTFHWLSKSTTLAAITTPFYGAENYIRHPLLTTNHKRQVYDLDFKNSEISLLLLKFTQFEYPMHPAMK